MTSMSVLTSWLTDTRSRRPRGRTRTTVRSGLEELDGRWLPSGTVPTAPVDFTPDTPFKLGNYFIDVPSSYDASNQTPTTLFVWSHGAGGFSQFDIDDYKWTSGTPYIEIALDGREGGAWDVNADPAAVLAAIADVKTHFNIDPARVILGGYSSGGDLSYRVAFTNSTQIAGVLAENTTPFRDTGLTQDQALSSASFKFHVVQLAHTEDDTYPIDAVRSETDAVKSAGFPLQLIERPGQHFDDNTVSDFQTLVLPHISDGWTSPATGDPGPGPGPGAIAAHGLVVSGRPNGAASVFAVGSGGQYATTASATLSPFGSIPADVRAASADVDGDTIPDAILVTGPGTPLRVAVISGANTQAVLVTAFDPFGGDFTGGGFVAAGDFDKDGRAEFVVTPDQGGGPRVSVFSILAGGLATTRANFLTLNPDFRGGARAAVGDVNGDGTPDLAVAAGFGGGPQVTLINGTKALTTDGFNPADHLINDFFAFDAALRNGAYVAIGDVDGDGFGDLVFGAGPGGAPRLLAVSGRALLQQGAVNAIDAPLSNFFVAGNVSDRGGVRVAVKDVDGDNRADVVVGSGEASASKVRVYLGKNFGGGEPSLFQDLDPFAGAVLTDGVFVG
jgi:predicted esterase